MMPSLDFCRVTSVIWAVVSDGKQAYAFKYRKDETVYRDKVFDLRGNRRQSANFSESPSRSGYEDRASKVTNEIVRNFIPTIAARLEQGLERSSFDYLVIVAPRNTLEALRGALREDVRNCLLANLPEGFVYDKGGPLFALREEASANFDVYTKTICRSLPPCCTRNVRRRVMTARSASYGSTDDAVEEFYTVQ